MKKTNTSDSNTVPNMPSKVFGHSSGKYRSNYPSKVPEKPIVVPKPIKKVI